MYSKYAFNIGTYKLCFRPILFSCIVMLNVTIAQTRLDATFLSTLNEAQSMTKRLKIEYILELEFAIVGFRMFCRLFSHFFFLTLKIKFYNIHDKKKLWSD